LFVSLLVELLDKSVFIQLLDKTAVDKFIRFVIPDVGTCRGDVFEAGLHSHRVGIRDLKKVLGEEIVV
jgi:hypothetical protein